MYIGLPGRISQEALPKFLMSSTYREMLCEHFATLRFGDMEDGLVLCIDCFPIDSPIRGEFKRPRRVRDTRVRSKNGEFVRLPTLHSAGVAVDHEGLLACKTPRDVAIFLSSEVRRQAPSLFETRAKFDHDSFCRHLELVAMKVPNTAIPPRENVIGNDGKA
jgi:hypothetical protein